MTVTLDLPQDLAGALQRAAQMQGKDIATLLMEEARRQLRRDVLTPSEGKLLAIINAPIAPKARRRRDALLAEKINAELTREQEAELSDLIDAVEVANAKRWQAVAHLARRRGVTLAELAADLQLPLG